MAKVKPPFRLAVAAAFLDGAPHGMAEILDLLQKNYAGEKICTPANIEDSLQSLKAVGILTIPPGDSPEARYALSRNGRERTLKALGC